MTKPHCWRCVTVNKCWFANAKDKKPEPIYKQNSLEFDNLLKDGLYHPNCHCEEIGVGEVAIENVQFIIPFGKLIGWLKTKGIC